MSAIISLIIGGAWKYIAGILGGAAVLFAARKSGADAMRLAQERMENKRNEDLIKYMEKEKALIHSFSDDPDALERMCNAVNSAGNDKSPT